MFLVRRRAAVTKLYKDVPHPDAAGVIDAPKASHAQRRNKVKDRARRG